MAAFDGHSREPQRSTRGPQPPWSMRPTMRVGIKAIATQRESGEHAEVDHVGLWAVRVIQEVTMPKNGKARTLSKSR